MVKFTKNNILMGKKYKNIRRKHTAILISICIFRLIDEICTFQQPVFLVI